MTENERTLLEVKARSENNTLAIEQINVRLSKAEEKTEDIHSFTHSIANSIDKMAQSFEYMRHDIDGIASNQKELKQSQEDLKTDMVDLKNKPNQDKVRLFDKVTGIILGLIATGIGAFLLGQLCPNIFK